MEKVIKYFGSQVKTAAALGVKQGHLWYWMKKGVPIKRAIQIEKATRGQITRKQLRPDIFE